MIEVVCGADPILCEQVYRDEVIGHVDSMGEYFRVVLEVVRELKNGGKGVGMGLIDHWIEVSAREAENDG